MAVDSSSFLPLFVQEIRTDHSLLRLHFCGLALPSMFLVSFDAQGSVGGNPCGCA